MKQIYIIFLLLPVIAFGKVDFTGSLRVRTILPKVEELLSKEVLFNHSFRLKGAIHPSQDLQTHFWLFSSSKWGEEGALRESFRVYPYGIWNMTDELQLQLGRIPYEIEPSVLSQNDYELFPYVFDGVFLNYSAKSVILNIWGAYPPSKRLGAMEKTEFKYSLGAELEVKIIPEFFKKINFYLIYLTRSFEETETIKSNRYGLNIEGEILNWKIDYNISIIGQESGLKFNPEDTMYDVEAGYSQPEWYDSRVFIAYHRDTKNYNPWLYDRHEKGGLMDMLQWGNLTYILVGYNVSLPGDFSVKLKFLRFQRTTNHPFYLGWYGALFSKEQPSDNNLKNLGNELDLQITKDFGSGFQTHFLGSFFIPEKGIFQRLKEENIFSQLQLTALYKF